MRESLKSLVGIHAGQAFRINYELPADVSYVDGIA